MKVLDILFDSILKTGNFECRWQAKGWLFCFENYLQIIFVRLFADMKLIDLVY